MTDRGKLIIQLLIKLGLIDDKFYGKLSFDFQNGKVVHYTKTESGKL